MKSNEQNKQRRLQKELRKIIKKMKRVQKTIAADEQPVARSELAALTKLGQRYSSIINELEGREG